ncbi:hypothetical protein B0H16DRAFT_1459445 [Mycena metata]|uniref:Uncharacterized protein n=1 Tax=Mycena metata TaxID=1033252 RepID=A0AAD7IZ05_9AGAR|nr:hypothetical protein B0H16DRAFT_1459445 [Mycena metata]
MARILQETADSVAERRLHMQDVVPLKNLINTILVAKKGKELQKLKTLRTVNLRLAEPVSVPNSSRFFNHVFVSPRYHGDIHTDDETPASHSVVRLRDTEQELIPKLWYYAQPSWETSKAQTQNPTFYDNASALVHHRPLEALQTIGFRQGKRQDGAELHTVLRAISPNATGEYSPRTVPVACKGDVTAVLAEVLNWDIRRLGCHQEARCEMGHGTAKKFGNLVFLADGKKADSRARRGLSAGMGSYDSHLGPQVLYGIMSLSETCGGDIEGGRRFGAAMVVGRKQEDGAKSASTREGCIHWRHYSYTATSTIHLQKRKKIAATHTRETIHGNAKPGREKTAKEKQRNRERKRVETYPRTPHSMTPDHMGAAPLLDALAIVSHTATRSILRTAPMRQREPARTAPPPHPPHSAHQCNSAHVRPGFVGVERESWMCTMVVTGRAVVTGSVVGPGRVHL